MTNNEAVTMIKDDMRLHHNSLSGAYRQALNMAVEALKFRDAYNKQSVWMEWIPCSERLPEDWVPVLVTLKMPERLPAWIKTTPENYYHIVDADVCENGVWSVNGKNVLACMPLPEPYRGKQP